jgi:hypothetical protein
MPSVVIVSRQIGVREFDPGRTMPTVNRFGVIRRKPVAPGFGSWPKPWPPHGRFSETKPPSHQRLMVRRGIRPAEVTASRHGQTSAKPRSGRSQAKPVKPIVHHNTRARSKQAGAKVAPQRLPQGGLDRACHPAFVCHQAFDGEERLKPEQMACHFFSRRHIRYLSWPPFTAVAAAVEMPRRFSVTSR